jgi:hypothetical protein
VVEESAQVVEQIRQRRASAPGPHSG